MSKRILHFDARIGYHPQRIGRFELVESLYEDRLYQVAYILAGMVILEANKVYHTATTGENVIQYTAISPSFRKVSPLEEIPKYWIEVQVGKTGMIGCKFIEEVEGSEAVEKFIEETPKPKPKTDLRTRVQQKVKALVEDGTYVIPEKPRTLGNVQQQLAYDPDDPPF